MSKEIKNLQKRWNVLLETVHSNSHVVAFMNSRVGRYLDDHPFVSLSLLVFIAASAIPVALFLVFVVATIVFTCIGVIIVEGFLITLGGITLLCVLGGLGVVSLAVSGVLSVLYMSLTTLLNCWPILRLSVKKFANGSSIQPIRFPALYQDATSEERE
ncbi:lipid droplet assembly factor 1 [Pogona vitticeps]|uniref:Lipid droplet assembly factor 1 n=1 Tax=Pogona vitticeps TaxID=103695 RepID=A0ABM5EZQ9_9SAUR